jgi:capsular polysaccharide biosynthesis protein
MDLKQYLSVPIRRYKTIIIIILLFLLSFLFIASYKGNTYPVTMFYTISLDDDQETTDFKYSSFYAIQSGLEFTRTVSGWFEDPAFESQVFEIAKINKDEELNILKKLLGFFSSKRVERQNIRVTFSSSQDERSHKIAEALTTVLNIRLDEYNENSNTKYKIALSSKWVELKEVPYLLVILLSIFMGLFGGALFVYIYEYVAGKISTIYEAENIFNKKNIDFCKNSEWSNDYLIRVFDKYKLEIILGINFLPEKKNFKNQIMIFPKDIKNIDENKNFLVVCKLGITKAKDLEKIKHLIKEEKRELVVIV